MSRIPKLILFDYGGVFADHYCQPFLSNLATHLGSHPDAVLKAVSEQTTHGRAYRLNEIGRSEFWQNVRDSLGCPEFDDALAQELWAKTYIPNRAMISLAHHLRGNLDIDVGLILNEDCMRLEFVLEQLKADISFSVVFASCDVGEVKPEPRFYDAVLDRLKGQYAPSDVLVVDDRETHVHAARAKGMQAWQFSSAGALSRDITNLILLNHDNTHS
jgi:FMN phosphatase YigB (HAD superfamily)